MVSWMLLAVAMATPLGDAVQANSSRTVAKLLEEGADPNREVVLTRSKTSGFWIFQNTTRTSTETTPLHLALERNRLKIARMLLEGGADPDVITRHRLPPLHHVAMRGRWFDEQVALLLEHGAQPQGAFRGRTALAAVKQGKEEAFVDALVKHGADVQALACDAKFEHLELLIGKGAVPNGRCGTSSLMHRAAADEDLRLLTLLLEAGGDPNLAGIVEGREVAPLHVALAANWTLGIDALLQAGADPQARVGVLGHPPAALADPDHRGMLVRAGASRIRSDPPELWAVRPVAPGERKAFLEAWALDGLEPGEGWSLDPALRERFPSELAQGASIWGQLAGSLTPEEVAEALAFEPDLSCADLPLTFAELKKTWGPPDEKLHENGIKTWTWSGGVAVGRGPNVLEIRGPCGENTLVGRSRAFVWLAIGPGRGRAVEKRGTLRFYYRDGVVETIGVRSW